MGLVSSWLAMDRVQHAVLGGGVGLSRSGRPGHSLGVASSQEEARARGSGGDPLVDDLVGLGDVDLVDVVGARADPH
jgi:hypothetical protein